MVPIKVDTSGIPEQPTFVLATRSCNKLGQLVGLDGIKYHKCFNAADEIYFDISKKIGLEDNPLFNEIEDNRLIWYREVDEWFRLSFELDEGDVTVKHVTGTALCENELSQIYVHNLEINTESDILRDEYEEPTVFYDDTDSDISLIDRILYKCPNYTIDYVADSLKGVQRQFSWDDTTVYDALMDVSDEVGCLFVFGNDSNNGEVRRSISAYDLMSHCNSCGKRFEEHVSTCPYCGRSDITEPYGADSKIIVSKENLTKEVRLTSNSDQVKNCFYLEGGDDFMTSTIRFLTPDGSGYLWYLTDDMKKDMSYDLQDKIAQHDALYEAYLTGDVTEFVSNHAYAEGTTLARNGTLYWVTITDRDTEIMHGGIWSYIQDYIEEIAELLFPYNVSSTGYNTLITKYDPSFADYSRIYSGGTTRLNAKDIILDCYADLTEADYSAVDFYYYLNDSMMPTYNATQYTISQQASRLASYLSSGVSLLNISTNTSQSTVETAIKSMSRHRVDRSKYDVTVNTTSWAPASGTGTWRGTCTLVDNSDSDNTATTSLITITFTSNAQDYISQLMQNRINNNVSEAYDIEGLFGLSLTNFTNQLKLYSLSCLKSFYECCQGCIDILIRNGCGNPDGCSIGGATYTTLYTSLYQPWYNKLQAIQAEMDLRSTEVATVQNMMDQLEQLITKTQDELNFEDFIGETLWREFVPYRREQTYTNSNFISDGQSNAELIKLGTEFLSQATKELYKAAELQHSISSTLYNLLIIPEFSGLVDNFDTGVWIRVNIDETIYLLRLLEYTVDWGNYSTIDVQFSDVDNWSSGYSDLYSVINSARSMATGVGTIQRQAERGNTAASLLSQDLDLTKIKLVSNADNQEMSYDKYGMYMREYDDIIESYSPEQLKITNHTIAFTDDNWETMKMALGKIIVTDGTNTKEAYGLLAENIIGTIGSFVQLSANSITAGIIKDQNGGYNYWNLDTGDFRLSYGAGIYDSDGYLTSTVGDALAGTYIQYTTGTKNTATTWASNISIASGDYVIYGTDDTNRNLYICNTAHTTGTNFDSTKFTAVSWSTSFPSWGTYSYIWQRTVTEDSVGVLHYTTPTVQALDQSSVFNRLTNNGNVQGITLSNGELYINASYVSTGVLTGPSISTAPLWTSSTSYAVGDYVSYGGTIYYCKTAHTSSSSFDSTKWNTTSAYKNYWNLGTGEFYVSGGSGECGIYHNGTTLTINASNLTTGTISSSNASSNNYWNLNTGAFHIGPSTTAWTANTYYSVGTYVTYNNVTYCCNTAHTSGSSWNTYSSYFTSANGKAAGISYNSTNGMNLYYNSSNYWDMKTGYFNFGGVISNTSSGKYIDPGYLSGYTKGYSPQTSNNYFYFGSNGITDGKLDAGDVIIENLNASNIKTGTIKNVSNNDNYWDLTNGYFRLGDSSHYLSYNGTTLQLYYNSNNYWNLTNGTFKVGSNSNYMYWNGSSLNIKGKLYSNDQVIYSEPNGTNDIAGLTMHATGTTTSASVDMDVFKIKGRYVDGVAPYVYLYSPVDGYLNIGYNYDDTRYHNLTYFYGSLNFSYASSITWGSNAPTAKFG